MGGILQKMEEVFKKTAIWKHFAAIADMEKVLLVETLITYAYPILDRVIETFPTYTLHNGQHQLNVLNRMGDLLGERIKELSDLEAAFLILAAFYHDIGMVFSKEERNSLISEENFQIFLDSTPAAQLAVFDKDELPADIAEWYCRWAHAKRVWIYLDKVSDKLVWEGNNIKTQLGEICLSHNEDIEYLKENIFEDKFWRKADMRFCSIILRLADILDFDNSRSPESVFEFLTLDNPQTPAQQVSHKEWEKHLASRGFSFEEWDRSKPYEILFMAAPKHPAVENDIREFLDTIELELQKCVTLIHFCSPRWQDFTLPDKIDRDNIRSQGYKWGNYKFSLDQGQILDLLIGEKIYNRNYTFVRELLQNAIDTSRHREFHEHKKGNIKYAARPIEVSGWIDGEGYQWFRVDDFGMGMDEDIIKKYFLKVGNSYYNSDEFKIRKLSYRHTDGEDFTPISRFGIGILSCFIHGDRVEVNTRSIHSNGNKIYPLRMALTGVHNFYVLQTDRDEPAPMPAEEGHEKGYRKDVGTSIAVRFNPEKDDMNFDVRKILEEILVNPPVKILLKTRGFIADLSGVVKNITSVAETVPFSYEENDNYYDDEKIPPVFDPVVKPHFNFHLRSLNLYDEFTDPNMKGYIGIILLEKENDEECVARNGDKYAFSIDFDTSGGIIYEETRIDEPDFYFEVERYLDEDEDHHSKGHTRENILFLLRKFPLYNALLNFGSINDHLHNNMLLSHNGIKIPIHLHNSGPAIKISLKNPKRIQDIFVWALIELKDSLRLDLSVSRNEITNVSWQLLSTLNYSIMKALGRIELFSSFFPDPGFIKLTEDFSMHKLLYGELIGDKFIADMTCWVSEKIIDHGEECISINDILANRTKIRLDLPEVLNYKSSVFKKVLLYTLLQRFCTITAYITKARPESHWSEAEPHLLVSPLKTDPGILLDYFPPLTFVKYDKFKGLVPRGEKNSYSRWYSGRLLNIDHPYSEWLIKTQKILYEKHSLQYWALLQSERPKAINEILDRLRKILPVEYRPERSLVLSAKDFEYDVKEE